MTFRESGGTVQVKQAIVEPVVPWARPVRVGRRYVIFGNVAEDGQLQAHPPATMYEEEPDGMMRRLMRQEDPFERDGIERLSLQQIGFHAAQRVAKGRSGQ